MSDLQIIPDYDAIANADSLPTVETVKLLLSLPASFQLSCQIQYLSIKI